MSASVVECVGEPTSGHVVWTCEHASSAIPQDVDVAAEERPWFRTHWGHDRGAAALVAALQQRLGGPALYAGFSRLIVDANRPEEHPDLCRRTVEGDVLLRHNHALTESARRGRVEQLHMPYHRAIDTVLRTRRARALPTFLFSVHTFTRLYNGQPRTLDLGVLFDETDDGAAGLLLDGLRQSGAVSVAPNAPWSGMDGLIYSVARHGTHHRLPYLELEVRDDLLTGPDAGGPLDPVPVDAAGVARIAELVTRALMPVVERWACVPS